MVRVRADGRTNGLAVPGRDSKESRAAPSTGGRAEMGRKAGWSHGGPSKDWAPPSPRAEPFPRLFEGLRRKENVTSLFTNGISLLPLSDPVPTSQQRQF